jgi:hypothetical protein
VQPPAPLPRLTQRQLAAVAGAGAVLGVLVVAVAVRGCRDVQRGDLEQRVARMEDLLGIVDGGTTLSPDASPLPIVSADDRAAPCAMARVAAYRAWTEAIAKAKLIAAPAQAACADEWTDKKKQACYYTTGATVRTAQAARDAIMAGGSSTRDVVKAVKDDPKNDALPRARTASDAVLAACDDEDGG